jgi:hypothetical protein
LDLANQAIRFDNTDKSLATIFYHPEMYRKCIESDFFYGLTNLKEISIFNMDSLKISKFLFSGLTNLQKISINGTGSIANLDQKTFQGLKKLKTLDISGGALDLNNIDPRTFAGLKSLVELNIGGSNTNPYDNTKKADVKKYCGCNVNFIG